MDTGSSGGIQPDGQSILYKNVLRIFMLMFLLSFLEN